MGRRASHSRNGTGSPRYTGWKMTPRHGEVSDSWMIALVSAADIIEQIKALTPAERAEVTKFVVKHEVSLQADRGFLGELLQLAAERWS
jgi:hypothetical protein